MRTTFFLFYLAMATVCRAEILDFNTPTVDIGQGYGPGDFYIEDGFRFATTDTPEHHGGSILRLDPAAQIYQVPSNGTVYFGATFDSNPTMDRPDGAAFSLSLIDLAYYSEFVLTTNITFQGNKADGTTATTTFTLGGPFDGVFHTFQFGPEWTDLTSVNFLTTGFAWDNISVSVVPEPNPEALAAGGLLVFAWAWRRKKSMVLRKNSC